MSCSKNEKRKKCIDNQLHFTCLNARSVKNKALQISDYIISEHIDVLGVTETWMGNEVESVILKELVPTGYEIIHMP